MDAMLPALEKHAPVITVVLKTFSAVVALLTCYFYYRQLQIVSLPSHNNAREGLFD